MSTVFCFRMALLPKKRQLRNKKIGQTAQKSKPSPIRTLNESRRRLLRTQNNVFMATAVASATANEKCVYRPSQIQDPYAGRLHLACSRSCMFHPIFMKEPQKASRQRCAKDGRQNLLTGFFFQIAPLPAHF